MSRCVSISPTPAEHSGTSPNPLTYTLSIPNWKERWGENVERKWTNRTWAGVREVQTLPRPSHLAVHSATACSIPCQDKSDAGEGMSRTWAGREPYASSSAPGSPPLARLLLLCPTHIVNRVGLDTVSTTAQSPIEVRLPTLLAPGDFLFHVVGNVDTHRGFNSVNSFPRREEGVNRLSITCVFCKMCCFGKFKGKSAFRRI